MVLVIFGRPARRLYEHVLEEIHSPGAVTENERFSFILLDNWGQEELDVVEKQAKRHGRAKRRPVPKYSVGLYSSAC